MAIDINFMNSKNDEISHSLICKSLNSLDMIILNPYRNHEMYFTGSKKTGVDLKKNEYRQS